MGKALYRSHRSTSFKEVIGQDHITKTLQNALKNGNISHAYLLTGPRGVGKTSVARILAYEVNELAYQSDTTHLDIIEIDAASNRRIDEIREIRDRVHIAPSSGKFKVYIVDEVHMLTREAFNALLKTLEEPPAHVIFILATTEIHKVPETIISRCIRLTFKPIESTILAAHLKQIAEHEKIAISGDALELLAEHGNGSFRDGITLLEQVSNRDEKVTAEVVENMLGLPRAGIIESVIEALEAKDINRLQATLEDIYNAGINEITLASHISKALRAHMISDATSTLSSSELLDLQKELLLVAGSPKPRVQLELCLFGSILKGDSPASALLEIPAVSKKTSDEQPKPITSKETPPQSRVEMHIDIKPEKIKSLPVEEIAVETRSINPTSKQLWPAFLDQLKGRNNTLYGIARMAEVEERDGYVCLSFKFAFHYKQINEAKNKAIFSQLLQKVSDKDVELEIKLLDKKLETVAVEAPPKNSLESLSNIFGAHEVLES